MGTPRGAAVIARALRLLVMPGRTWVAIAAEPADPRGLFGRYVAPLAAIPAVCSVAGPLKFGFNIANVDVMMSPLGLVLGAFAGYALTFAAVAAAGVLVALIARAFGGDGDRGRALELVSYAATASWIGGVAELYPSLGLAVGVLAGVYSLYTLYLGLPRMLAIPDAHRLTAFAAILVVIFGLWTARGVLAASAAELGGPLSASYTPLR
ncbi:Yip1 family protein [Phenylobacterium sp.]|uniref:Yip1 family protein n=1 Tax=Phenylobacterium sp. TaxID=1871053 RepID=UPI0025E55C01|nr:Yip1 family protein [Phenylobacterium sp.]